MIRYRQAADKMSLVEENEKYYAVFDTPQKGVASGQFCAWYDGEELLGSGVIA
jgi:tRNA-specific 2-thiouridylase